MSLKNVTKKLAMFFFPQTINDLRYSVLMKELTIERLKEEINEKETQLDKVLMKPTPTMADLMRETLGSYTINANEVESDGLPKSFLSVEDKDKRTMYITQLAQIAQLEVWEVMCKNLIDIQANFVIRKADGELQIVFGRGSINGITLLRNEVRKGFAEYEDGRKPKEEFDEFETTEGITIKQS